MPLGTILDRRLLIISGKGGVGKTTVSAALALLAARHDRRVLIAEVEGKRALDKMFGTGPLGPEPNEVRPGIHAMNISPEQVLREYFEVQFHLKRLAKPILASQLVYYVTHAAPGLRDILVLGKVWFAATKQQDFDLIILDTPAAGHAVSMLGSPEGFLHAVPMGPLAGHVRRVLDWLRDPEEVSIQLVTTAEETPVKETVETSDELERRLRFQVDQYYVNMLYPPIAEDPEVMERIASLRTPQEVIEQAGASGAALSKARAKALLDCARFYEGWRSEQQRNAAEIGRALGPGASLVELAYLFRQGFGIKELEVMADSIEEQLQG